MAFRPHDACDDYMAAAADLDIGAAQRRIGRLDAEPALRQIEDGDIVPRHASAHAGADHHFLPLFPLLHVTPLPFATVWTKTPDSRGKLSARDVDTANLIMPPLWSRLRPRPVRYYFTRQQSGRFA
jgi:hypothetical protein